MAPPAAVELRPVIAKRKRSRLRTVAVLAVLVAVPTLLLWPGWDRVTSENFDRIHRGMTRSEVEAILGPPGDYASGPAVGEEELWWRLRFQLADHSWVGNSAWIMVTYEGGPNASDPPIVRGFSYQPIEPADVGLVAKFVWRTQRGWERARGILEHWIPRQRILDG
jgi:hypothetical protein